MTCSSEGLGPHVTASPQKPGHRPQAQGALTRKPLYEHHTRAVSTPHGKSKPHKIGLGVPAVLVAEDNELLRLFPPPETHGQRR